MESKTRKKNLTRGVMYYTKDAFLGVFFNTYSIHKNMGIKKRLQNFWNKHLFPFELLYFVVSIFIFLMYLDIYKGMVRKLWKKDK